jgi:hypothetical protein
MRVLPYESNYVGIVRVNVVGCLYDTSSRRAAVLVPDVLELENRGSIWEGFYSFSITLSVEQSFGSS